MDGTVTSNGAGTSDTQSPAGAAPGNQDEGHLSLPTCTWKAMEKALAPGQHGDTAEELEQAIFALMADMIADGEEAVRAHTAKLVADAVACFQGGGQALESATAARIIAGLGDRLARDSASVYIEEAEVPDAARLWRYLVRWCPAGSDFAFATPPPLALLAVTSWMAGDALATRVAVTGALRVDPEYTFALMLADALDEEVEPEQMRTVIRALRDAHSI